MKLNKKGPHEGCLFVLIFQCQDKSYRKISVYFLINSRDLPSSIPKLANNSSDPTQYTPFLL